MDKKIPLPVITPDGRPPEAQPKWRHDFPIDVPEADYVARRDFTKFMVLTSLAFVIGQCWIGLKRALRGEAAGTPARRIASVADVPVGGAVSFGFPNPNDACLLMRTGPDDFVAYSAKCTHLSCAVLPDIRNKSLRCPCHNGLFDLATGRPLAGPPRRPLPRIRIEVRKGDIYATAVEERMT